MPMMLRNWALFSIHIQGKGYPHVWCYSSSWSKVDRLLEAAFIEAGLPGFTTATSPDNRVAMHYRAPTKSESEGLARSDEHTQRCAARNKFVTDNPDKLFYSIGGLKEELQPLDGEAIKKLRAEATTALQAR